MASFPLRTALHELAASEGVSLRIAGTCMAPAIQNGAIVTVVRQRRYWPGDVLVFFGPDGRLTAHRLLGFGPWRGRFRLFTRADNALAPDSAILPSEVVGRITDGVTRVRASQRLLSLASFLRLGLRRVCRPQWR